MMRKDILDINFDLKILYGIFILLIDLHYLSFDFNS